VTKSIAALDLTSVAESVSKRKLLKGDDLSLGEELYRIFLFLTKTYPKEKLVPHPLADIFWHEHILQTRKYHADCKKLFGKYLHHQANDPRSMKQDRNRTVQLVKKHFL
jgi:hypothetical protein